MGKYDAAKGPEQDPEAEPPPVDPAEPDLRRSAYQKDNIRVERNLNSNLGGDGHIARGNMTRFQSLNFSVRGRPADPGERDPTFTDRERGASPSKSDPTHIQSGTVSASTELAAPEATPAAPEQSAPSDAPSGVFNALKRLFGG